MGGAAFVPGSADTNGPYLNIGMAAPAGSFTAVVIYVDSMGLPGGSGPLMTVGRTSSDGVFTRVEKHVIPAFDGDVPIYVVGDSEVVPTSLPVNDLSNLPPALRAEFSTDFHEDAKSYPPPNSAAPTLVLPAYPALLPAATARPVDSPAQGAPQAYLPLTANSSAPTNRAAPGEPTQAPRKMGR